MCRNPGKYKIWAGPGIFIALLFLCDTAYSQTRQVRRPPKKIPHEIISKLREDIPSFDRDTLSGVPSELQPPSRPTDKSDQFYDSLKVRASKNRFTKRLVEFLIVNPPDTIYKKRFLNTSDEGYLKYAGKKIRNIEVRRLNVFGTDINYPMSYRPRDYEKLLNKTHHNTAENIVRKNLLFSVGDRVSPLILSDNERLLRQLPFIQDARIMVTAVSDEEADVVVFTKDVYSLGGSYTFGGLKKGSLSVFDKNILGLGHEFGIDIPYDSHAPHSPGYGFHYFADNIRKSFINLNAFYLYGLGSQTYGFSLHRDLISYRTKYAGGVAFRQVSTTFDVAQPLIPVPFKYNLQDYWLSRSFLVDIQSVTRIIIGARYLNNNVYDHPFILSDSYYDLQKYKIFMGSAALSVQKYTKTNLLYSYGRTEDIPYGALLKFTLGKENNEFKNRTYFGIEAAVGNTSPEIGYLYFYSGFSTFLNQKNTEQGVLSLRLNYFSNLINLGNYRIRNFLYTNYTRGFGRYSNEYLKFVNNNGFSGFRNDSIIGNQRLTLSLESVVFSPLNLYGFKFAFFGFSDFSFLSGTNEILGRGYSLSSIGLGFRIRNDNLIFNTIQVRFAYFPNPPSFSTISNISVSGVQLLHPDNFESGPPSIIPYR